MPLFRSTAAHEITFDAGETRYTVPQGGVCDLDRRVAYVPKARGLPLAPIERAEVGDAKVVEGEGVPRPRPTRVRGVASGDTVLLSDDGDDRAGEMISEHRAGLQDLAAVPSDDSASEPAVADAAMIAALANRRERRAGK